MNNLSDRAWRILGWLARNRMKTGAQSHSDVDRIQFGIGTHQYYMSKHHTAKHAKGKCMYITVIVMKGMNNE